MTGRIRTLTVVSHRDTDQQPRTETWALTEDAMYAAARRILNGRPDESGWIARAIRVSG